MVNPRNDGTIEREVEAREIGENMNRKQESVHSHSSTKKSFNDKPKTAAALHIKTDKTNIKCVYCGKNNFSSDCRTVADVQKRKEILKRNGRCFNCIGHMARNCERKKKCRNCNGSHHQSICDKVETKENEKTGHSNQKFNSTEKDDENVNSASQNLFSEGNESVVGTTKAKLPQKGRVLFQTAKTLAYGSDKSKHVEVRVLLDLGGQRSFISENVKNKLGLKSLKSEIVNLNTFGDNKYHKRKCDLVKVNLETIESGQLEIFALSTPTICSPIRSHVNVCEYPHLRGLQLADNFDNDDTEIIDILIGADQYFKVILDGKIEGESGPVAMNSKLGWLLAGPAELYPNSDPEEYSVSNLIIEGAVKDSFELVNRENRELLDSFKRLWEIESGTSEIEFEGNENVDQFDIKHNGKRYEISLPWRTDIAEPLSTDYLQCLNRLKSLHA